MRSHPARAVYDHLEDALSSMAMQLRSAIAAYAPSASRAGGRARGRARQTAAELAQPSARASLLDSRERLQSLASCRDAGSLRSAVSALCAEFGGVTKLDVVMMTCAEKRRALCFLRLQSAAEEQKLIADLGAARFGEDLLVIVDLPS